MKTKDILLNDVKNLDYVKRINEIETILDNNEDIKKLLSDKKKVSKEIVLAKKLGLINTVKSYEEEYKDIDTKINDYPLVSEYMDLLEQAHNDLEMMTNYIEDGIEKKLNS